MRSKRRKIEGITNCYVNKLTRLQPGVDLDNCHLEKLMTKDNGNCSNFNAQAVEQKFGPRFIELNNSGRNILGGENPGISCKNCLEEFNKSSLVLGNGDFNCDVALLVTVIAAHTKDDLWVRRLYECVGFLTFSFVHSVVHSGGSTLVNSGGDRRNSWPSVCGYFVSQMEMKEMFQGTSCGRYFGHVYLYYSPCALLLWWWELLLHLFGPKAQPLISTFLFICIFSPGTYKDPKMSTGAEEIVEGCSNCNGHKKMMNPQSSEKGKMNSEIGLVQNGYAMKIEDLETGNTKGCYHCYEMPNFESFKRYRELFVTPTFLQKIAAEIILTFILVFVTCGSSIMVHNSHPSVSQLRGSIASGLVVTVMIYSVGHIFGAHVNPAAPIAFATIRHFPWMQVLAYIGAQSVGALSASFTLRLMFESVSNTGILLPPIGELAGIVVGSIVMISSIFAG
eukprot:Gb_36332 [translate_table: standard]